MSIPKVRAASDPVAGEGAGNRGQAPRFPVRQVPLALAPEPRRDFEAFLPGPNALALAHLRSAVPPSAPVHLWGPGGAGKTHLLQALAGSCLAQGKAVGAFDAQSPPAQAFDPRWALVTLDDVHRYDAEAQRAAFALLVEAQAHGVAWASAADLPPVDLPLRDDLRSRLGWGHVFGLQPLDEAETRIVLGREAQRRGMALGEEVLAYLLSRCARDLGFLMRLLDRLDDYALASQRLVTVPLARQLIAEELAEVAP